MDAQKKAIGDVNIVHMGVQWHQNLRFANGWHALKINQPRKFQDHDA